ncbi:DNA mismatch repair endonuclease MutL [Chloracidobacterium sp. MS 40/45]|uniref:DNA mismatch repair endonuclease MutL n=1 Tax=Chloracidobacterium aggregatum TaxID=2851959 RepID=UPI001B8D93F7|nr:DNA mismatch repair endonuclease MutL [Chloracidobacterium aggregatum]QUW00362.1 DNA mismatch repair endonuclease MutL [Chloracidobacterium sp. MS 40/45]
MSKIRILPDVVANRIAAGEVVERPASIVKECLENALDAQAHQIDLAVERGGKESIRIRDDGEGMTQDDAILAFERHATSKIRTAEELMAIQTFGFRGEALAAIGSVARVTLTTKLHGATSGTEVCLEGGKLRHVREVAAPGGTEILVRDLFFNLPARRKFLKTEATEAFHITNLVTHYALAHPQCGFTLQHNGRQVLAVTATTDLRARAYQLFGANMLDSLAPVEFAQGGIAVGGFVSRPHVQRTSRDGQYLFVNRRFVRDKLIGRALSDAYRNILPPGVFPAAMLFVEVPPDMVDVNVHPQKTEVRFRAPQQVLESIVTAVQQALGRSPHFAPFPAAATPPAHPSTTAATSPPTGPHSPSAPAVHAALQALAPPPVAVPASPGRNERQPPPFFTATPHPGAGSVSATPSTPTLPTPEPPDEAATRLHSILGGRPRTRCAGAARRAHPTRPTSEPHPPDGRRTDVRILGQIHDSYIVAADADGLLLIDQHVAHERILFEQRVRALLARDVLVQMLLTPLVVDLSPAQATVFDALESELEAAGFRTTRLAGRTVAVQGVPADLGAEDAKTLLTELLDALASEQQTVSREHFLRELAASLACRAAIKVNMNLTPEKMTWLVDELFQCAQPTNCPHGRPVILRFDMSLIERGFKRT